MMSAKSGCSFCIKILELWKTTGKALISPCIMQTENPWFCCFCRANNREINPWKGTYNSYCILCGPDKAYTKICIHEQAWLDDANLRLKEGDDLLTSLRVPLLLGAFAGVIPIRGLRRKVCQWGNPRFTWFHYRTIISIVVITGLLLHTIFVAHSFVVMLSSKSSAGNLILSFSGVWFYSVATLIYTFFLMRSKKLCQYFETWLTISNQVNTLSNPDNKVRRDVNLIAGFILLDTVLENVLYHIHAMPLEQRARFSSLTFPELLRDYYKSNQYIFHFFPYSPFVSVALLVTNKLATYAWNYGDAILIVFFRTLYGRYKSLNKYIESQMEPEGSIMMVRRGSVSWRAIRKNYLHLTALLKEGNSLFTPLIWLSYVTDIFFVCRQLYEGLVPTTSRKTAIDKVYVVWSLIHLIMRTLGVNMMAAMINEEAHRTFKIIQLCHPDEYCDEVRRLERFLAGRIIGITGSRCFYITRKFVLMIISAIFTLEVVLLQNSHLTVG